MTEFSLLYLVFTAFLVTAGLTMITTYTLTYPWWRSGLGRMMVLYASAEITMSAILCLAVVFHVTPVWFRALWFTLQVAVGCTFCVQTAVIVRLYRRRRRERSPGKGATGHVIGSTDAGPHR